MDFLRDRRLIALGGASLALAAGLLVAWIFFQGSHRAAAPPPASQGGLVVVSGREDDAKLDPKRPLRCFVAGQFVGELPLAVCAQRNGVATGALDVGLDQAGALAAGASTNTLTPLQPPPPQSLATAPPGAADGDGVMPADAGVGKACWRYGAAGWRPTSTPLPLMACVQAVFADRCPTGDDALYGRWGERTLRLMDQRVEVAPNNRDFTVLTDPWPSCDSVPAG